MARTSIVKFEVEMGTDVFLEMKCVRLYYVYVPVSLAIRDR